MHAQSSGREAVELTPDKCAVVTSGDDLVIEWNPAFDLAGVATGLQQFELTFAAVAERGGRAPVSLHLVANPRLQHPGAGESPITALTNGLFRVRFHPQLSRLPLGQYELVDAVAFAQTTPEYQGVAPRMTNSPVHSPFCLNVIAPSRQRGAGAR